MMADFVAGQADLVDKPFEEELQKTRARAVARKEKWERDKKALQFVQSYTGVRKKEPLRGELSELRSGFWSSKEIRRFVELDEHTGMLVLWTHRPPKNLVYKIEELHARRQWSLCGQTDQDKAIPIGIYDMKHLMDVDACKPYQSIFLHFRRRGLILIAPGDEEFEQWLNAVGQFVGVSSSTFKWTQPGHLEAGE
mmetsp:Transcript_16802/g.39890  ORF Transcript_16802/g.39890 Transcript_16802/m.39890 type:complete len:195 (-) Transcript_16802:82-666(-)